MRVFQSKWFIFLCRVILWGLAIKGYDILRSKINMGLYIDSKALNLFLEFVLLCVTAFIIDKIVNWFQNHFLYKIYQNE